MHKYKQVCSGGNSPLPTSLGSTKVACVEGVTSADTCVRGAWVVGVVRVKVCFLPVFGQWPPSLVLVCPLATCKWVEEMCRCIRLCAVGVSPDRSRC